MGIAGHGPNTLAPCFGILEFFICLFPGCCVIPGPTRIRTLDLFMYTPRVRFEERLKMNDSSHLSGHSGQDLCPLGLLLIASNTTLSSRPVQRTLVRGGYWVVIYIHHKPIKVIPECLLFVGFFGLCILLRGRTVGSVPQGNIGILPTLAALNLRERTFPSQRLLTLSLVTRRMVLAWALIYSTATQTAPPI